MFSHEHAATMGLWPQITTTAVANLGLFYYQIDIDSQPIASSGGWSGKHSHFFRHRAEEQTNIISILISYDRKFWNKEYEDHRLTKVHLKAVLAKAPTVQPAPSSNLNVKAAINNIKFIVRKK